MVKAIERRLTDLERKSAGDDDVKIVVSWDDDLPEPGTVVVTWDKDDVIEVKRQ